MADLIKKIKIKKQDGTFTDYIPIGAEAQNISTSDGDSVQLKLGKKPYYYNSIADMKADTKLKVGDIVITSGYYSANDGGGAEYRIINGIYTDDGGSYHELDNNLWAELIIKDNLINVKQFGAKGDGVTDDSDAIQNSANKVQNIYIPEGDYLVSKTINLPFNIHIQGMNQFKTKILTTIKNDYTFVYGSDYDYNGLGGIIEDLQLKSSNALDKKPDGFFLYSSMAFKNVRFSTIGQCIARTSKYIDDITLDGVVIGYCVPNGRYLVDLAGNMDGLNINQLKTGVWSGDTTKYNGLHLQRCHGAVIKNSILNWEMTIEDCNAIHIQGCHMENSTGGYLIKDSDVTFTDCFKYKNKIAAGSDIILQNAEYSKGNSVRLLNCGFYITGVMFNENGTTGYSPEIQISSNSIVSIESCFREINLADNGRTMLAHYGISVQDSTTELNTFNDFSYQNSINSKICYITSNYCDIQSSINYNEDRPNGQGTGSTALSSNIKWLGDSHEEWHYKIVSVIDEDRKLMKCYSSDTTVSNIVQNAAGLNLALNAQYTMSNLHIFSGASANNYTKETIVPTCTRNVLLDNGYQISGFMTQDRAATNGYSLYTKTNKYIKEGKNVTVWLSAIPTKGTWISGDRVVNTNIGNGNSISWVYDGSTWISEGYYEESSI